MKRFLFLFAAVLLLLTEAMAGDAKIVGSWMITKAENGGKTQDVYQIANFKDDGYAEMAGRVFGSWEYDAKANTLTIESEMIKQFSGKWTVAKLTKNEMVLQHDDSKINLIVYDKEKIKQANQKSGFIGSWKLSEKNMDQSDVYLSFNLPDEINIKEIGDGFSSRGGGMWFFDTKSNTVVMLIRERSLRGKSKVIKINADEFVLENNGKKIAATRLKQLAKDREILVVSDEEDTSEEKSEINSEECLWFNQDAKMDYLKRVKQLKYQKKNLLAGFDAFISEDITANVSVNEDENTIDIEPIFDNLSERDYDGRNAFYPIEDIYNYSIIDDREVTVPAGTFLCKVIEKNDSFNQSRTRYYMIKNRPGVYAKIITVKKNNDKEEYTMYELSAIEGDFNMQDNKQIIGDWLLTALKSDGKISNVGVVNFEFINDGRLSMNNAGDGVFFSWNYDKDTKMVTLNFGDKEQVLKITKSNEKELELQNDKLNYSFVKFQKNADAAGDADPLLYGYWMLIGNNEPYKVMHLKKDNSVYEMDRISKAPLEDNHSELKGKWMYNASESSITFNTDVYESICNGKFTIKKLNDNVLVLGVGPRAYFVFLKIDPLRIEKENKKSGIIGLWKVTSRAGKVAYYNLQSPYIFNTGKTKENMYGKGLWFYNPATETLFLGYQTFLLQSEIHVNKISKNKIELDGGYTAERVK
jgi:hypothetical protein